MSLAAVFLLVPFASGFLSEPQAGKAAKPPVTFASKSYIHRYSKGNQHEYTPKAQTNLQNWTDMFTINDYPSVKDGEGLATAANNVLETYKAAKAVVVRTNSVPRTSSKPAEHLIVVLFPRPNFIEAAFARFVMSKGSGASLVYSHRIYGKKAGDAMSAWLRKEGERIEKALMAMPSVPKH